MRAFAVILVLLATFGTALADGRFFRSKLIEAEPTIPFQRAVLKFDGREQIMLVESTLSGPQGDYGWVVPLPTKPSYVKAVNPAFVQQSFNMAKPPVRSGRALEPVFAAGIVILAVVALTSGLRYRKRELGMRILFFFLEMAVLFLGFCIFFPVFAKAELAAATKSAGGMDAANRSWTRIEDLGRVGSYDVAVISGNDGQEILKWLKERNLAVGDDALPIIESYAKEGWCFMAAEVRKNEHGNYPPHPIKAVFPSDRLIYPMRLTGLQSEPLILELLVVSNREATLPGMKPWACDNSPLVVPIGINSAQDKEIYSDWQSGQYAMAKQGAVWTYLRGEFKPEDMRKDFLMDWKPMKRHQQEVWDGEGAKREGIKIGFEALGIVAVFVGLILACWTNLNEKIFAVGAMIVLMASISRGAFWYESVEKVDSVEVMVDRNLH